jgi:hypothetical protein
LRGILSGSVVVLLALISPAYGGPQGRDRLPAPKAAPAVSSPSEPVPDPGQDGARFDASPNMPPISTTPNGFIFPTTSPVPSDIVLVGQSTLFAFCPDGSQAGLPCVSDWQCPGSHCERVYDNTFCLGYNEDCVGQRANPDEYAFNDVFETTYDHSPEPGRQTWIERNWNYTSADGTGWRPFHFHLDVDANSTCVGGTNEGAYCTLQDAAGICTGGGTCKGGRPSGAAEWTFRPNNRDGNTSLVLRWPWATINAKDGTDPWWAYGFSTWMRTSDFDPGTSTSGANFTTYVDHANDRLGTWISGVHSTIDFNTTSQSSVTSWVIGGSFDARISGTTSSRELDSLIGLRSNVDLAATGTAQDLPHSVGLLVSFNPSGSGISDGNHTGILIDTPSPTGPGTTIATQNGLWVADQQLALSGGDGSAILVSAQTTTNGSEGNVRLEGGGSMNGHVQLGQDHLWRDAGGAVLRYKSGAAPGYESDGKAVVTGTSSDSHGLVFWGVSTETDPDFDTGAEVCAASGVGLTCVETAELKSYEPMPCDQPHNAPRWIAFCK